MKWQLSTRLGRWAPWLIWVFAAIAVAIGGVVLVSARWLLDRLETELLPVLKDHQGLLESLTETLDLTWQTVLVVNAAAVALVLILALSIFRTMRIQFNALQESRARNRAIVDNLVDGVVHIDGRCDIVAINQAGELIFGYQFEELRGRPLTDLFASPFREEYRQQIDRYLYAGAPLDIGRGRELSGMRKDGSEFPMYLAISEVTVGGPMFTGIVRDMSEHKQAMADLERARDEAQAADIAKSQFLANMSHEIRTPMNGVMGMLDLLRETDLSVEQREFADTALRSGQALLNIINDILDFSKIEAGALNIEEIDFDLRDDVEEVTALLAKTAHAKGLEVASYIPPEVPSIVRGDPYRLRQVLMNLIGNAVKFTDRGEVVVGVEVEVEIENDLLLKFQVSDTGIGIEEEVQRRLFQPFSQADGSTTRRFGGTGLGLAISKRLVALMGGKIGADSRPGEGSCFWFTICVKRSFRRRPRHSTNLTGVRVLVVDDNTTNRTILEKYLSNWGIEVQGAEDGYQALEMLTRARQRDGAFDLAILDMQMPFMDGIELAQRIKADESLSDIALVMLSSHGYPGPSARVAGIEVSLVKPVRQALLWDTLVSVLRKRLGLTAAVPETPQEDPLPELSSPTIERGRFQGQVLIVEDNLVNQKVLQKMLQNFGIDSVVANNGQEAVEAVDQNRFDLILMDVQMPVMDGLEATRLIREAETESRHLPIMAMTASAMKGDQEKCMKVGMDDYLAKPINKKALEEKLGRWLPHSLAT